MKIRFLITPIVLLFALSSFAWDSNGHRLTAQIAYDNLTPTARERLDQLLGDFVMASVWADKIRSHSDAYSRWHYIAMPLSLDGSKTQAATSPNAVTVINKAILLLKNNETSQDEKLFQCRFLIHVVADLHQPLHVVNAYSRRHPNGDRGGNFFKSYTPIANNLHQYWDRGAGLWYRGHKKQSLTARQVRLIAKKWQQEFPREKFAHRLSLTQAQQWADESYQIAKRSVYNTQENDRPTRKYQLEAKRLVKQQLVLAGYRLADVMNAIFYS